MSSPFGHRTAAAVSGVSNTQEWDNLFIYMLSESENLSQKLPVYQSILPSLIGDTSHLPKPKSISEWYCPGCVVQLVHALSHVPKGCRFDPWSAPAQQANNWCFSLALMFLFLSFSKVNKHILSWWLKKSSGTTLIGLIRIYAQELRRQLTSTEAHDQVKEGRYLSTWEIFKPVRDFWWVYLSQTDNCREVISQQIEKCSIEWLFSNLFYTLES